MLELALDNLAMYARVALCGDVSSYDNPNPPGVHVGTSFSEYDV